MNDSSVSIIFLDLFYVVKRKVMNEGEHTRYNKRIQILRNSNFRKINRLNKKVPHVFSFFKRQPTHLYSRPTVAGFFAGNAVKSLNKIFNSPIAFAGFKPLGQTLVQFKIVWQR